MSTIHACMWRQLFAHVHCMYVQACYDNIIRNINFSTMLYMIPYMYVALTLQVYMYKFLANYV
jgi:hypothetical protein